jgi:hypothetical protein
MKKIITFFLAAALAVPVAAQYDRGREQEREFEKERDVVFHEGRDKKYNDRDNYHYYFSKRELYRQISDINRKYDYKIQDVKNNFFMNRFKKERIICMLEDKRKDEIKWIYTKFNSRKNKWIETPGRHS